MARLLLDTHALFWALYDDVSLSDDAGTAIRDPSNAVYATTASAQEIALALSVGRWRGAWDLLQHFEARVEDQGYGLIVPTPADYANQLRLPTVPGHKDPYDKLIITQAIRHDMMLVTADPYAPRYPVRCIEAGRGPELEPRGERIVPEGPLELVEQQQSSKPLLPEYQDDQVILRKLEKQLVVSASDEGIIITHGWAVGISLDDLKHYVENYSRNSPADVSAGFYFFNGEFHINHRDTKLILTPEEATAIVAFLSKRYGLTIAVHLP